MLKVLNLVHRPGIPNPTSGHPFQELVYFIKGSYRVTVGKNSWKASSGDIFFFPELCPHTTRPSQDLLTRLMVLQWSGGPPHSWMKEPLRLHDRHGRILVGLTWMYEHSGQSSKRRIQLHELLAQALFLEMAALSEQDSARGPVEHARMLLEETLADPWTMPELSQHVGLASSLLTHRFKQTFGQTPMEYLRALRLRRALNLIQSTRLPLKTIAVQVGLQNQDHLCVLLKRNFGRTSRELRGLQLQRKP